MLSNHLVLNGTRQFVAIGNVTYVEPAQKLFCVVQDRYMDK